MAETAGAPKNLYEHPFAVSKQLAEARYRIADICDVLREATRDDASDGQHIHLSQQDAS